MKAGGRLVNHARYYWQLLAEGHLTAGPFVARRSRSGWKGEQTVPREAMGSILAGGREGKMEILVEQRLCVESKSTHSKPRVRVRIEPYNLRPLSPFKDNKTVNRDGEGIYSR